MQQEKKTIKKDTKSNFIYIYIERERLLYLLLCFLLNCCWF